MDNLSGIIIAFITGVLGPVILILIKNWLDRRKKKPDMVQETLKVSELIKYRSKRQSFFSLSVTKTETYASKCKYACTNNVKHTHNSNYKRKCNTYGRI